MNAPLSYIFLDTESIYSKVIEEICSEYGKTFTWEIKAQQMGQTEHAAAIIIIGKWKVGDVCVCAQERERERHHIDI